MALAILDGTQTATTLSTILSSGQHITAHTVVSLGTQAITDMRGAVSGSVVSISNFPAIQTISGTVTVGGGSINAVFNSGYVDGMDLLQQVNVCDTVNNLPPISGTVTANLSLLASHGQSVTKANNQIQIIGGYAGGSPTNATVYPIGIDSLGDIRTKVSWVGLSGDQTLQTSVTYPLPVQILGGSVTVGNTVTIAGTVTANIAISSTAITSGSFSSLTSATLVPGNVARKMATVYNLGAGQLFVNAGASATTLGGGFMVALSSGDFYECDYTTTTLSAIFATAGTASWVSH